MKSKLLICGDSFAVDYNKVSNNPGWANFLTNDFSVTNRAQPGCSEYRILKQIQSENIELYDIIIISHTSPNRVYINQHPIHKNSVIHQNSDLLYNDVLYHVDQDPENKIMLAAKNYFENIFDMDYHEDLFFLFSNQLKEITKTKPCLHLFTLYNKNCNSFKHHLNLKKHFKVVPDQSNPNHYTPDTNLKIYNLIKNWIEHVNE
jgi:hypothetical protein